MSDKSDPVISGVGQSEVGRFVDRLPLLLTIDAIREALDDAGLGVADIDGVATWPGRLETSLEMGPVGVDELVAALGIKLTGYKEIGGEAWRENVCAYEENTGGAVS